MRGRPLLRALTLLGAPAWSMARLFGVDGHVAATAMEMLRARGLITRALGLAVRDGGLSYAPLRIVGPNAQGIAAFEAARAQLHIVAMLCASYDSNNVPENSTPGAMLLAAVAGGFVSRPEASRLRASRACRLLRLLVHTFTHLEINSAALAVDWPSMGAWPHCGRARIWFAPARVTRSVTPGPYGAGPPLAGDGQSPSDLRFAQVATPQAGPEDVAWQQIRAHCRDATLWMCRLPSVELASLGESVDALRRAVSKIETAQLRAAGGGDGDGEEMMAVPQKRERERPFTTLSNDGIALAGRGEAQPGAPPPGRAPRLSTADPAVLQDYLCACDELKTMRATNGTAWVGSGEVRNTLAMRYCGRLLNRGAIIAAAITLFDHEVLWSWEGVPSPDVRIHATHEGGAMGGI